MLDLDTILCIKTERTLKNDHTIQHNRKLYQIEDRIRTKKVMVEERIDGTMRITSKGVSARFHQIVQRPPNNRKNVRSSPKAKVTALRSITRGDRHGSENPEKKNATDVS